ncbi:hypothetical protein HRbin34_00030 [bacterium HR34]|nr:hypothetical protein HRbin34_00030 [bacterium HR34]
MNKIFHKNLSEGSITLYAMIMMSVFLIIFTSLVGMVISRLKAADQLASYEQSLAIAEAGINYYRWCLNHNVEGNCPINFTYEDSQGVQLGRIEITNLSNQACGEIVSYDVVSKGYTLKYPTLDRSISIQYARESVGKYVTLLNDSVWAGADIELKGLYHSNGGIRMDGENQSLVTSTQTEWVCTLSFGCSVCPTSDGCRLDGGKCMCPGVFTTANGNKDLFSFPVPPFDFNSITVDIANIKSIAQSSGIYLPPSVNLNANGKGYHVILSNNSIKVNIITKLSPVWAYSLEEGWHYDYFIISSEVNYATYNIHPSCAVAFFEDDVWVEGTLQGKLTLVSAQLPPLSKNTNAILPGSISYNLNNPKDAFTLIAENNILIGPQSPNDMELRGIFIAQNGRFGRNLYLNNYRNSLEVRGSIISNGRVGTKWICGGSYCSGYARRENSIDTELIYNPAPFTPFIESKFKIINWEEL